MPAGGKKPTQVMGFDAVGGFEMARTSRFV
jgi:hypothetical protein